MLEFLIVKGCQKSRCVFQVCLGGGDRVMTVMKRSMSLAFSNSWSIFFRSLHASVAVRFPVFLEKHQLQMCRFLAVIADAGSCDSCELSQHRTQNANHDDVDSLVFMFCANLIVFAINLLNFDHATAARTESSIDWLV